MFDDKHPWHGEEFGPMEYYWYLQRQYCMNLLFELNQKPIIDFCKARKIPPNQLFMKIAYRLSQKHLPQKVVSLNRKAYPARYPTGYVRKVSKDSDMLEWVAVREKEKYFVERLVRDHMHPVEKFLAVHYPRLSVWLVKHFFGRREVKGQYALMVSRNPMPELGFPVTFHGTHYRTFVFAIPFGEKVWATFGAPHAFANVDYYKGIIGDFKKFIEHPETIPQELVEKRYDPAPYRHEKKRGPRQAKSKA